MPFSLFPHTSKRLTGFLAIKARGQYFSIKQKFRDNRDGFHRCVSLDSPCFGQNGDRYCSFYLQFPFVGTGSRVDF